ncbi:helix-turn-helix domain-containing protein [Variovorax sp. KBS0712]|uniref:helix-turn-helix domain-containing protein n=1 Tax=Variovorax TaxID=34072 RepID=UPI0011187992|nr:MULTISPECIES: helix-turn-helix domain-containing protein [Variovorax]MDP9908693.1 transcriptional regulator with XRE-family HTH domain [Variovorax boronicumulans]TSD59073.1 helix-turn-helix domain-containing protein [Variovorax sp. KBS0712]
MKIHTTIAERIAFARAARGMPQGGLAASSGIAATQVSRYETGRAVPRKLALARLAQALAVSLEWLATGEGEMDEYPETEGEGLIFRVDEELADRLRAYAYFNGLTLVESVADIFDAPLSAYSDRELPSSPTEKKQLQKLLRPYKQGQFSRIRALADKVQLIGQERTRKPEQTEVKVGAISEQQNAVQDALEAVRKIVKRDGEPLVPDKRRYPQSKGPSPNPNARKPKP